MAPPIIEISQISKRYRLGTNKGYLSLREQLARQAKSLLARPLFRRGRDGTGPDAFWALRDVSFTVNEGEAIGIIGRNGAGKSTLLKILSKITPPTEGKIVLRGRVASLLEVGTGFHPELTGRENIYLNGAILGMRRAEIRKKFDEIVDFAEIEKFLDTPVKRYSSGMYVRLAFAVAAHLEPEILVVDEVLAVGDSQFQKKCLGKMGKVAESGRTVIFVSHNMAAMQNLCARAILLAEGQLLSEGTTDSVLTDYLSTIGKDNIIPLRDRLDRKGNGVLRFTNFYALTKDRGKVDNIMMGESVTFVLEYESFPAQLLKNVSIAMRFSNHMGQDMFILNTRFTGNDFSEVGPKGDFRAHIKKLSLMPGSYFVTFYSAINEITADWILGGAVINVIEGDFFGTGFLPSKGAIGVVIEHSWRYIAKSREDVTK
jgi:lipopolysaccharide transport system ATP-binding protein